MFPPLDIDPPFPRPFSECCIVLLTILIILPHFWQPFKRKTNNRQNEATICKQTKSPEEIYDAKINEKVQKGK